MVPLCFPRIDASTDMQHGLESFSRDLDLRPNFDIGLNMHTAYFDMHISTRLDEGNTMVPKLSLVSVVQSYLRKKKHFLQNETLF